MRLYRRTIGIVASTFLGLTLIFFGLALFTARSTVFPRWYRRDAMKELPPCTPYQQRVYIDCVDPGKDLHLGFVEFAFENNEVKGHEGPIRTSGWAIPADGRDAVRGTVILVPGGGADRRAMLRHAGYLHDDGYHVVLIDCHNQGLSGRDGKGISFGYWEAQSVVDAAIWAKQNLAGAGERKLFAMGTSQGGFAVLRAMALSPVIQGVVAENPYISLKRLFNEYPDTSWEPWLVKRAALAIMQFELGLPLDEIDVHRFVGALGTRPVLLIHGEADRIVSPAQSHEIYDLLQGQRDLWFVPEGEHEQLWNIGKRAYEARVLRFLDAQAGEAPLKRRRAGT